MTINEILYILKSQDDTRKISDALYALEMTLDDPMDEFLEEVRFDFLMEDGIQILSNVIRRIDMENGAIYRGMNLLFQVAEENACHWHCIWTSLGEREGMIQFLEAHCTHPEIFSSALNLCRRVSYYQLLRFEAKDLLRWMPLWDLLLCGIENYIDRCHDIFSMFCHFLESVNDDLIPIEMHVRIQFALQRGLKALQQSSSNDFEFQEMTFDSVLSRYRNHDGGNKEGNGRRRTTQQNDHCYMLIPCSAAA